MNKFDEIRRLNSDRANAALVLFGIGQQNMPVEHDEKIKADCRYRLAQDAWLKAELAYRSAVDALSHSELLDLLEAHKKMCEK